MTVTPKGAVSAGGGGTAGSSDPTLLMSLAGAGLLGTGGIVLARRRRATHD